MQFDEYRLEAFLFQSGILHVYRGLDLFRNRQALIRVIAPPNPTPSDFTNYLRNEAQTIAKLNHPHISRLYRLGKVGQLHYLASQYIHGVDLRWIIDDYRRMGEFVEPLEASRIFRQVGDALDYAHRQGVVHQHLKPSYIIIDPNGRAYLTHFGLALLEDPEAISASPDRLSRHENAMPTQDLDALAQILYETFTGQAPAGGTESNEPRTQRPEISPEVEDVLLKALEHSPRNRYLSGAALSAVLEQALHAGPIPISPAQLTVLERVRRKLAETPLRYGIPSDYPSRRWADMPSSRWIGPEPPPAAITRRAYPKTVRSNPPPPQTQPREEVFISLGLLSSLIVLFLCVIGSGMLIWNMLTGRQTGVSAAQAPAQTRSGMAWTLSPIVPTPTTTTDRPGWTPTPYATEAVLGSIPGDRPTQPDSTAPLPIVTRTDGSGSLPDPLDSPVPTNPYRPLPSTPEPAIVVSPTARRTTGPTQSAIRSPTSLPFSPATSPAPPPVKTTPPVAGGQTTPGPSLGLISSVTPTGPTPRLSPTTPTIAPGIIQTNTPTPITPTATVPAPFVTLTVSPTPPAPSATPTPNATQPAPTATQTPSATLPGPTATPTTGPTLTAPPASPAQSATPTIPVATQTSSLSTSPLPPTATASPMPPPATSTPSATLPEPTSTSTPEPVVVTDPAIMSPTPSATPNPNEVPRTSIPNPDNQLAILRYNNVTNGLVISNNRELGFDLTQLLLLSENGYLAGTAWDPVIELPAGSCAVAWQTGGQVPAETTAACMPIGEPLWVDVDNDIIFLEDLQVFYNGILITTCNRNQPVCIIQLP